MTGKCFDTVSVMLDEESKRLAPKYVPSDRLVKTMKKICAAIDRVLELDSGTGFSMEINENHTLYISFYVEEIKVVVGESEFFQFVLENSQYFEVENMNGELLKVHLVFPSVWEPVNE